MSDQKRGQRYHSEPNEGWYALLAQPNALTRLPQIVASVAADAPEWAKTAIEDRRVERRRLERAVVTAAVKERAADKAVKASPQWRPIEDRTDYSSQLMTLMAAQSLAKNGLHETVDALAAFLEAHGEEK